MLQLQLMIVERLDARMGHLADTATNLMPTTLHLLVDLRRDATEKYGAVGKKNLADSDDPMFHRR